MKISLLGKYFWYTVFFVFSVNLFAQSDSGRAYYRISFPPDSEKPDMGAYKNHIKAVEEQAANLRFVLDFDRTHAMFSLVKDLPIDRNDFAAKTAVRFFGGDNAHYTNLEEGYFLKKKTLFEKDFQIKTLITDVNWNLTKVKRTILGYVCYKAIGSRYSIGKDFKKRNYEIVAWYCPELPFGYGPFEAVGLPGMVIQLDLKGYKIILDAIDLMIKPNVKNLTKGKLVTQKEYDSISERVFKSKLPY